jgi:hypothetical protein
MAKTKKKKQPENGQIPIEAVPHLFNKQVLAWFQTIFKAISSSAT